MTNREKFADEIIDIVCTGYSPALKDGKLVNCKDIKCNECMLNEGCIKCSGNKAFKRWADQEYIPDVDWSKVEVDTPILVRDHKNAEWSRRHFAKYENGIVYAWVNGNTSWTKHNEHNLAVWKYVKLAEEEDKNDL